MKTLFALQNRSRKRGGTRPQPNLTVWPYGATSGTSYLSDYIDHTLSLKFYFWLRSQCVFYNCIYEPLFFVRRIVVNEVTSIEVWYGNLKLFLQTSGRYSPTLKSLTMGGTVGFDTSKSNY